MLGRGLGGICPALADLEGGRAGGKKYAQAWAQLVQT